MHCLASFPSRRGEIVIMEHRASGARSYYENGVFQAHATPGGTSIFAYVHLMTHLLRRAENVLVLGCASGSLATMLWGCGKRVTLVDDNPVSFEIARHFFGLPAEIRCITRNFHDFMEEDRTPFDGIGIDIAADGMCFDEEFDAHTCRAIRTRLSPGGIVAMNVIAAHDLDPVPDRIVAMLAANDLYGWIYDQPGQAERNVILSCASNKRFCFGQGAEMRWGARRRRLHLRGLPAPVQLILSGTNYANCGETPCPHGAL